MSWVLISVHNGRLWTGLSNKGLYKMSYGDVSEQEKGDFLYTYLSSA